MRKTLGFPRVFNTYRFEMHTSSMNIFFTSIETNKHTYGSSQTFSKAFLFRKYRIFWWFSNNTKHWISNTTYELTNISYVDVFQNTCILREPVNQRKSYFSDGLQFIYVRIEQFIFGNVIFEQCISCKRYWLYYINAWWRMLLRFIYIQCYGIQLSHNSPRTFPPSGSGVWQVGIRALFIAN